MISGRAALLVAGIAVSVSACATRLESIPPSGSIIPSEGKVQVTANTGYSYSELLLWPVTTWALDQLWSDPLKLYFVYQPFAANWSIEEATLDENTYYVRLQAKRYRTGGDGEAMSVLKRRATQLQHERGFAAYRILEYSEGIESNTIGAQKYSEGIVQFARAGAPAGR
jgi:hypothetical protein